VWFHVGRIRGTEISSLCTYVRVSIENVPFEISAEDEKQEIVELQWEKRSTLFIEEAEVVVAGGAGIGSREDWQWIERLSVLNGAVGGTRPPLDGGWIAEGQMISQSGKTIRPKLYIGMGISGLIQHVVGIQDAKMIIAINNDPKAAIFQTADLEVVSDFRKVIPLLIEELKERANPLP